MCFTLGGLTIRLAETPGLIADSMGKAFSMSRSKDAGDSIVMSAVFLDDDAFLHALPPAVKERYNAMPGDENPLAFLGPAGEFCCLVRNGGTASLALIDPGARTLRLSCQRLSSGKGPLHFQSVLIPALKHLLLKRGKLLLHAGCVATEDGRGVLFAGLSGAGKTTTCIALSRAGFRYISDDLVVLSVVDGKPVVEGIREHMNLTKQTIAFFPEFAPFARDLGKAGAGNKVPVNPVSLFGDRISDRAFIDSIMVIVIGKDGPRLEPVNPPAILNVILQNHTFETGLSIPRTSMDILWNILGSVKTWKLMTGADPTAMGSHVYGLFHNGAAPRSVPAAPLQTTKRAASSSAFLDPRAASSLLRGVLGHTLDGHAFTFDLSDINKTARLFLHHRLEAHLARWMQDTGSTVSGDGFDPARILSNASALAVKRSTVTERVVAALRSAGIDPLLLRGTAVAKRFYPDEALRTYRDIDLIIGKDLLPKAADIMQGLGFRPDRDLAYWGTRGEWPFTDGETIVELHWEAYPSVVAGTPGLGVDDIRASADRIFIGTTEMSCLSVNHLLLSSFLHAAYDHYFDRLVRLVDIRQIMKLSANTIDWAWIGDMVRRTGTAIAITKALECIDAAMPLPVTDGRRSLPQPSLRKRLADTALPNDRIITGQGRTGRFRRMVFLQALKPVR
ncbi:MAG: nucleotidyltransferase family protein [Nitrospirota bacterium]